MNESIEQTNEWIKRMDQSMDHIEWMNELNNQISASINQSNKQIIKSIKRINQSVNGSNEWIEWMDG